VLQVSGFVVCDLRRAGDPAPGLSCPRAVAAIDSNSPSGREIHAAELVAVLQATGFAV